jgi:membrane protease YdiL (CAAX protease family)
MTWLLRSPFSSLVDRSIMLITVRGRRSGVRYTLPLQYASGGDCIWVFPGHADRKTWWRNLLVGSAVELHLRGRNVQATAQAFVGETSPSVVEEGFAAYIRRFPTVARRSGVADRTGVVDEALIAEVAKGIVMVRVAPTERASLDEGATRTAAGEGTAAGAARGAGSIGAIRRHPLRSFYLLTFLLSWGYWIPVALLGGRWSHAPGLLGPMLSAMAITTVTTGASGFRDLAARMLRWRVRPAAYVWAMAPLLVAVVAAGLMSLTGDRFPSFAEWTEMNGFASIGGWAALGLILVVNCYGEETGWRGFALPEFRRRHNELTASLLISVPWALWHLPTFFIDSGYRDLPLFFLPGWLLGFFAASVVLTWLFEGARSSILIVALMHLSLNLGSTTAASEGAISGIVTMTVIVWSIAIAAAWRRRDAKRPALRSGVV